MASWCSRLARQPVTLEVDGSSPFEVAKKEKPPKRMAFLFCQPRLGLEPFNATPQWGVARRVRAPPAPYNLSEGQIGSESVRDRLHPPNAESAVLTDGAFFF